MALPPTVSELNDLPTIDPSENIYSWIDERKKSHHFPSFNELKAWCDEIRTRLHPSHTPKRITSWGSANFPGHVYYVCLLCFWWNIEKDKDVLARYVILKQKLDKPGKKIQPENDMWFEKGIPKTRDSHLGKRKSLRDDIKEYSIAEARKWIDINLNQFSIETILSSTFIPANMKQKIKDSSKPHIQQLFYKKSTKEHIRACLYFAMGHSPDDATVPDVVPGATNVFLGFQKFINYHKPQKKYKKNPYRSSIDSVDIQDVVIWINKKYEHHQNFCKYGCVCDWPKGINIQQFDFDKLIRSKGETNSKLRFAYAWKVLFDDSARLGLQHITGIKQTSDSSNYQFKKSNPELHRKMKERERLRSRERRANWTPEQKQRQLFYDRRFKRNNTELIKSRYRAYDILHDRNHRPQNKEYTQQYNQTWSKKWKSVKERCVKKNRELSITEEEAWQLTQEPCSYCGIPPLNQFHGIDRFDNNLGYTSENSVSACGMCNCMKSNVDFSDWIQLCVNIVNNRFHKDVSGLETNHEISYPRSSMNWNDYVRRINEHQKENDYISDILLEDFSKLSVSNCYYCDMPSSLSESKSVGLDRIDSSQGYLLTNVVPCCSLCNRMKNDYQENSFLNQCLNIVKHFNKLN